VAAAIRYPLQLVVDVELVALPLQLVAPQLQLEQPQQLEVEQLDHAGWSVFNCAVSWISNVSVSRAERSFVRDDSMMGFLLSVYVFNGSG
jgi:hypothetical protein